MSDDQRDSPERSGDDAVPSVSTEVSAKKEAENDKSKQKADSKKDPMSGISDPKGDDGKLENESEGSRYIKLRVVGNQDANGINFRLKYTTALLKLKKSYSNHVGIPTSNLRFLFDGRRISDEDTPKQLDMNDDDQIEVYHEQTGGL